MACSRVNFVFTEFNILKGGVTVGDYEFLCCLVWQLFECSNYVLVCKRKLTTGIKYIRKNCKYAKLTAVYLWFYVANWITVQ